MVRMSSPGKYWRSSSNASPRPRTREPWRPDSKLSALQGSTRNVASRITADRLDPRTPRRLTRTPLSRPCHQPRRIQTPRLIRRKADVLERLSVIIPAEGWDPIAALDAPSLARDQRPRRRDRARWRVQATAAAQPLSRCHSTSAGNRHGTIRNTVRSALVGQRLERALRDRQFRALSLCPSTNRLGHSFARDRPFDRHGAMIAPARPHGAGAVDPPHSQWASCDGLLMPASTDLQRHSTSPPPALPSWSPGSIGAT
jgi:hypothetical protein